MLRKHILLLLFALDHTRSSADCHEETNIVDLLTHLGAKRALTLLDFLIHHECAIAFFDPNFLLISFAIRVFASAFQVEALVDDPPIWGSF